MDDNLVGSRLLEFRSSGHLTLPELQTKEILRLSGLPVPESRLVATPEEAVQGAEAIGYPVVLKVHSLLISHKSDVGGVKLNLDNALAVESGCLEILSACRPIDPKAQLLVQKMLPPGIEAIIGVSHDRQFGPVVMFGLGGVFTELFNDVVFRLIPVSNAQAQEMVVSIRGSKLLKGYRGKPAVDVDALTDVIVRVSDLIVKHPEILELDLNPIMAYPEGAAIADARMVLKNV
jgi:acyl-CoA synthetase (NDP forming)